MSEFRLASSPNNLFITELVSPTNIIVLSSNNSITSIILGKDRSPPTQQFNVLDDGPDGFLSVPNNRSLVSTTNATLQPDKFGMDFWESLEGQLVTIPKPFATAFQNNFGEFWVRGDWKVTGKNSRGGLTVTFGKVLVIDFLFSYLTLLILEVRMALPTVTQRLSSSVLLSTRPRILKLLLVSD